MNKKFVTGASFALGGAGIVLVGYLSANPLAFTRPVAALPFEPASAPIAHAIAAKPAPELVIPEVNISAALPKREKATREPARLVPCSEWKEIGAALITPAGATGTHHVRQLCPEGTSPTAGTR
jgi:hypothetical protein